MDRYVGLDAHARSCTLGVIGPSGKRLKSMVVETSGQALVEAVRSIPGRVHLCLEEGTQSAWLYELLSPHVEEVVVVVPPELTKPALVTCGRGLCSLSGVIPTSGGSSGREGLTADKPGGSLTP